MVRIKREPATPERDGRWQIEQLEQGWYTADFDFETNEYVMKRTEDIPTITRQQARLLSYRDIEELTPEQRRILFGDEGE